MDITVQRIYDFICQYPNCTEREIAEGVGLKKTPYSRWILLSLISSSHIARFWDEGRPRKAYVYYCQQTEKLM